MMCTLFMLSCRCYYKAKENTAPEIVQQCLTFMQSEAVFLILSNLTGLSLHALAANRDADSDASVNELLTADKSKPNDKAGGSREGGLEICSSGASDGEEDKKTKPRKKRRRLNSRSSEGGKSSENTAHLGKFDI